MRKSWDSRAQEHGTSPRGVLFKGLSEDANAVLHAWHVRVLAERFLPAVQHGGVVADLGCGYGRLAKEMASMRPDLRIVGQDLSHEYCLRARAFGCDVVQSSLEALPFSASAFSGAIAVTSLMYVPRTQVTGVLRGIRGILASGAPLLLVDPGAEAQWIGRMVAFRSKPRIGNGFAIRDYPRLAEAAGFRVVAKGGNPGDSLAIAASAGGRFASRALRYLAARRDSQGGYCRLALHRWLLLEAPSA